MTNANMRLLLGSGGLSTPERVEAWLQAFDAFLGDIDRFLFVPHALAAHDRYVAGLEERGFTAGRTLVGLHREADPVAAVEAAPAIFVGGGNSFRLLATIQAMGLIEPIRRRVAAGMPYIGISAGSNLACPTIMTTNDMPITAPDGLDALDLVPFQINPHYFAGRTWIRQADEQFLPYGGETRDDRIREFHEMNTRPVLGVWEGGWVRVEGGSTHLEGSPARLFRRDADPVDLEAGTRLDALL
ncbi:MAG: dipeptidase PepE [Planctomycetota bacterium]|nr:dipeptidase PepE [Planctomycetota bacterium]